jgi:hypothetical protein
MASQPPTEVERQLREEITHLRLSVSRLTRLLERRDEG